MKKQIVWDMDGTLFDLYGVSNWLPRLRAEDVNPYFEATPMWNMVELREYLMKMREAGWKIVINSWLAKDSTKEYKKATRNAKQVMLSHWFGNNLFDEIHLVQYGTPKTKPMREKGGYLIDDNAEVRAQWERNGGIAFDPATLGFKVRNLDLEII